MNKASLINIYQEVCECYAHQTSQMRILGNKGTLLLVRVQYRLLFGLADRHNTGSRGSGIAAAVESWRAVAVGKYMTVVGRSGAN